MALPLIVWLSSGTLAAMAQSPVQPFAVAPGEGFAVPNPTGALTTFKAMADACGGSITAIEGSAAPGEGPPLHIHRRQDELIYTLEGMHRVKLGDQVFDAPVGTFIFIPRGTPSGRRWATASRDPRRCGRRFSRPCRIGAQAAGLRVALRKVACGTEWQTGGCTPRTA